MKKLLLLLVFILLTAPDIYANRPKAKRYGFTATFRIARTSKDVLLDYTLAWIRENLPTKQFYLRDIDPDEGYATYRATNKGDFGKVTYDLTFYAKNNVVDVVADNVEHYKTGRLPREMRSKGTPKRKTKKYLSALARDLEQHLRNVKATRTIASKN